MAGLVKLPQVALLTKLGVEFFLEGAENLTDSLFSVRVGKGAFLGLEYQLEGDTLLTVGYLLSGIDVEHADPFKKGASDLAGRGEEAACRQMFIDQNGQVTVGRGELGYGSELNRHGG